MRMHTGICRWGKEQCAWCDRPDPQIFKVSDPFQTNTFINLIKRVNFLYILILSDQFSNAEGENKLPHSHLYPQLSRPLWLNFELVQNMKFFGSRLCSHKDGGYECVLWAMSSQDATSSLFDRHKNTQVKYTYIAFSPSNLPCHAFWIQLSGLPGGDGDGRNNRW